MTGKKYGTAKRLIRGRASGISAALCLVVLLATSCVSGNPPAAQGSQSNAQNTDSDMVQSSSEFNSSVQASSSGTGSPVEVTNVAFFDYNGDGILSGGEYEVSGITLTYNPGNISCVTDRKGQAKVQLVPGNYKVSVSDASNKFTYLTLSKNEFNKIGDGLTINVQKNQQVSIPLAQGFLTWPFYSGTPVGVIWYFEPTRDPTVFCSDST